jgi:hypothetical protein
MIENKKRNPRDNSKCSVFNLRINRKPEKLQTSSQDKKNNKYDDFWFSYAYPVLEVAKDFVK